MTSLLAAELFKLRTTRTFYGMCLAVLVVVALIVSLSASLDDFDAGDEPGVDLLGIASFAQVFALVLGILGTTTEFRHGTITPTLLAVPNRGRLLAAKAVAHILVGLLLGIVAFLFAAALGSAILETRDIDSQMSVSDLLEITAGGAVASALYAGLGVGLGAMVGNQVGALVGALAWLFVLEGLISAIPGADFVFDYGLNGLGNSLTQTTFGSDDQGGMIEAVPAGVLLAIYALTFIVNGALLLHDRDIESKT